MAKLGEDLRMSLRVNVKLKKVGKEDSSPHFYHQEKINEILYKSALDNNIVVRLKVETHLYLEEVEKRVYT